jgi:hypothetical protein
MTKGVVAGRLNIISTGSLGIGTKTAIQYVRRLARNVTKQL